MNPTPFQEHPELYQPSDGDPDDGQPEDADNDFPRDMTHHMQPVRKDSPRVSDLGPTPAPTLSPLRLPPDVHKVNGRQLNPATRKRDRDMLNR